MTRLILASASPRRLELLREAGYDPIVAPAHADETPDEAQTPAENAARLARDKALAIAPHHPRDVVVGADTVVVSGRALLGKPVDRADAERMLRRLAGRVHQVVTCVHIAPLDRWPQASLTVTTAVVFRDLAEDEIQGYLDAGEWEGKAGGYAVQGRAAAFTQAVMGSYTNVVGLPLCEVVEELALRGLPPRYAPRRDAAPGERT